MKHEELERLYQCARNALRQGLLTEASDLFRYLVEQCDTDGRYLSFHGLLLAIRDKRIAEGTALCKQAITLASCEPDMYLNLSRVYQRSGQHNNAVNALRKAVRRGARSRAVMQELQRLSPRSGGPLSCLHRDHFLNKYLGKLLARVFGYKPRVPATQNAAERGPASRSQPKLTPARSPVSVM